MISSEVQSGGAGSKGLRVLVVEDNEDAAETLRMLLEVWGHEIALAHTGPAAIAEAARFRPHVVLCDLGLPEMDGLTVARFLRRDPGTAQAFLVALSGFGDDGDVQRARQAGFDLHLTKPVEPKELQQLLTRQRVAADGS